MAGHTKNSIEITAPRSFVFERTNDLAAWTTLFTEYASVEILHQEKDYVEFRLTTFPDEDGRFWSWTSWRRLYPSEWRIEAARIEPLTPFSSMAIRWYYDEQDARTIMHWEQDFTLAPTAGFSQEQATAYLNRHTQTQMVTIKRRLEQAWAKVAASHGGQS